jgi:site-specific DNA-methyltransferase (adenine-specific)
MKEGDWHMDDFIKKAGKQMRSVWSIPTPKPNEKKFGKHPTQKPMALLERVVLASTNEMDLILDPFTGSSTTGLVAQKYNRKFIGMDMEEDYLKLSVKRFQDLNESGVKKQLPLITTQTSQKLFN